MMPILAVSGPSRIIWFDRTVVRGGESVDAADFLDECGRCPTIPDATTAGPSA
jgi:hypothetical protein